jgi:hypothetical protein
MHRTLVVAALVLAFGASPRAQTAPPPAGPAAESETLAVVKQSTVAHGDLPDLGGRWLVLMDLDLNGTVRTTPGFYEITGRGSELQVVENMVVLPADLNAQLEEAHGKSTPWKPSAAALAIIRDRWATLPGGGRGAQEGRNELWAPEALDDAVKKDPITNDTVWVMCQTYIALRRQPPGHHVNVFAWKAREGDGWRGDCVSGMVVAAPFPVPITFQYQMRMIRLGDAGEPSWFARCSRARSGAGR